MRFIYHTDHSALQHSAIGGKARNLHQLEQINMAVPEWGVIPAETLSALIGDAAGTDIKAQINKVKLENGFIRSILDHFPDGTALAVRSSADMEDGTDFSFAGQFSSFMYVSPEKLEECIRNVWLSAFSERILSYRKAQGIDALPKIAVIIQRMVDAGVSGVAFGIDPSGGDRKTKIVTAVYGLGEGLVSGELVADVYRIRQNQIFAEPAQKTHQFVRNENWGLTIKEVEPERQQLPALKEEQIRRIGVVLDRLKDHFTRPQDIEFAFAGDKLYLLQTRPITSLQQLPDPEGEYIVWDNSNIIESYPGVTLPLTFSFIIKVYEAVYRQFCGMMGVSTEDIKKHENVFAHMLGLLQGRVYYNLLSWYRLLALLPGYSLNAEFMEKMMGVKERFTLNDLPERTRLKERLRVVNMAGIMLRNLRALPGQRRRFTHDFNTVMDEYRQIDLDQQRPEELLRLYLTFEKTLLEKWKAPLVNDFFAMIYFGLLQKLSAKYVPGGGSQLHNDLLCGAKDIISTEPVRLSREIVQAIRRDDEAVGLFIENDEGTIWRALQSGRLPEIRQLIDHYLEKFGDRCVGELKLETLTYHQQPENFVRILRSFLSDTHEVKASMQTNSTMRQQAEQKAVAALKGKPVQRLLFGHVLRQARSLVSQRENLRYERTRAFGMVRRIFSAIGRQFYASALVDDPRDIFYLTKEEIFDYIQGASVNTSLKKLITLRKEEFNAYENLPAGERIPTRGVVYQGNDFNSTPAAAFEGELKGIGCCPGRVKARVRVLRRPDEISSLEGDILVTSSTDPGWVILFPSASAVLVERGSLLSHSAIVSREMGIPCVVGVSGLLSRLKTGDWVEMDGSTGEIKILDGQAH